ncbi:MAG TPA: UDP-3-O-(3-hydroxymyristoyl)glucosamine N-acyltransferase [Hyphomicrobiaceae bacterium]|nr:UDP-3-O-(3-hydroxymyristoyl)glucosamine N-acyltransferase [Hyphomicrobiaceae bacterium]
MEHPGFFERAGPFTVAEIAAMLGGEIGGADPVAAASIELRDIKPLDEAVPGYLTFIDNRKYVPMLGQTRASAVLVAPQLVNRVPAGVVPIILKNPYRGFAQGLMAFYPGAGVPNSTASSAGEPAIHPTARIEEGARIEPGAVVGREAWIGRGTIVAAGAVIGYRVTVGRDCFIGPCASAVHALIGDRVILHAGVRIGQDGFGFAMGAQGHLKVPQIGRVIIQNDVEIGSNSTVDRGALKDTVIGEGTKIDNLVQIGHNVRIGRHCVIVAQVGVAGSSTLEDFVVLGGQCGISGHVTVGMGAQIAGATMVIEDVPAGAKLIGLPGQPIRDFLRERGAIKRLVKQLQDGGASEPDK